MATTTAGTRSPDLSYAGSALASSTIYYWRIAFSDDDGATGIFSTTTSSFILSPSAAIQAIAFSYDANGNILSITESAATDARRSVTYTYDSLNRLTRASTTAASSTPYRHHFAYSMLGNITGMSTSTATTTYTYAETGYANPHAVTSLGGTTYSYDNNGNVSAIGSLDYTWDWRNRLASAARSAGGFTTYGYDQAGQRVFQATGSATTSYPSRYYNVASSSLTATTTKHIFSPDGTLLATVVGSGVANASTTYIHPDHLGGTNVTTNSSGVVTQTLDYYPYGAQRIASGSSAEQRRFIGEEYDGDTDFSYLNARYYQGSRGQFMSQDPVFLLIGDPKGIKQMTQGEMIAILSDPQVQNSYSYARDNPLILKDPGGTDPFLLTFIILGIKAYGWYATIHEYNLLKSQLAADGSLSAEDYDILAKYQRNASIETAGCALVGVTCEIAKIISDVGQATTKGLESTPSGRSSYNPPSDRVAIVQNQFGFPGFLLVPPPPPPPPVASPGSPSSGGSGWSSPSLGALPPPPPPLLFLPPPPPPSFRR
jgi:RHS repeat-associated protein